jgi:hypothetical protein
MCYGIPEAPRNAVSAAQGDAARKYLQNSASKSCKLLQSERIYPAGRKFSSALQTQQVRRPNLCPRFICLKM